MTVEESAEPRVLERAAHPVSRKNIDTNALKVLYRLNRKGYKAYLVGGSVRDLMLGRQPKDFDVATDASPQEVRRLFRNGRIIGRRFRLVHVIFKEGVIEVSTFRRDPDPEQQDRDQGQLLVTSDNTWGTPREDAFRRDFTVNALFYDIGDFSVIDYVGGVEDLERRMMRTIGDPDIRFQEDPVRMLRACELAGRLAFGIDPESQEAIGQHKRKLDLAAPARLAEELLQLMRCGAAGAAFQWMLELGLLEVFLPEAGGLVGTAPTREGYPNLVPVVDRLVSQDRELRDATLLGALFLPQTISRRDDLEAQGGRLMTRGDVRKLVDDMVGGFTSRFTLPQHMVRDLSRGLAGFHRLCEPGWRSAGRVQLAHEPYFDTALELFELMVVATGEGEEELERWQAAARRRGQGKSGSGGASRRRRRRRRNR